MNPDPAAFHRALLDGPRGARRERGPVPAVVATLVGAEAVLGALGPHAPDVGAWVVLGLLGSLGVLLFGAWHLPPVRGTPAAPWLRSAAALLERVLLPAACTALAATVLGDLLPALAGREHVVALVLLALAAAWAGAAGAGAAKKGRTARRASTEVEAGPGLRGRSAGPGGSARLVAVWCGAVALGAVILAGVAGGAGTASGPVDAGRGPVLSAVLAVAAGGALVVPALTAARRRRPVTSASGTVVARAGGTDLCRVVWTAAPLVLVTALVLLAGSGGSSGGASALLRVASPATGGARGVLGALLVVALVAAAVARPPVPWMRGSAPRADSQTRTDSQARAESAPRGWRAATGWAAAVVVVLLADAGVVLACYVTTVLGLALLTLAAGRTQWRRDLGALYLPGPRRAARRGRAVTGAGAVVAGGLLAAAAVTGWPAVAAGALLSGMMWAMSRHDRELRARLALTHVDQDRPLPTAVRAYVVVTELDRPTVRAVAVARALRATSLEALSVPVGEETLRARWAELGLPVPLVELAAPPGRATAAVVEHVASARRAEPDALAVVYLPAVTARGWRRALLGRRSRTLREQLLALPGTVVTTVPWPIEES